jgi:chromosome segregation ATPase
MGRLTRELAKIELLVQPLRKRETELQAREDALRAQIKRREGLVKKAQGELQKIRESKELSAGDRIAVLEADIEAANGEIQSCNVQLLPLQEDLGVLRRDIAKHMGTIAALREEEAGVTRAMDREQERHRVSTGGAKSAYREALRSLATAAQRGKVAELCAAQHKAVVDATERARKKLEAEELQRAANNGYDVAAYKRGMFLIVGTTTLLFVVMLAKIIF